MTARKDGNVNVNAERHKTESKMAKPDKKKPAKQRQAPASSGSKRTTLADLWDETDPGEASNFIPEGEHEVRLNEIEHKVDKKKGEAAFARYEAIEGEYEGRTGRQMYKLTDEGGNKAPGMAYLMRDLALLGYEDIKGKDLIKTFKEISEEQPMVVVNAKQNGQYTNYFLQGLVDDSGIDKGKGNTNDADDEIAVGDTVEWDDEGTDRKGEVQSINKKKETAKVKDDEDDEHTVDIDDLTKVEADSEGGEGDEIAVGDTVEGENDQGDEIKGEVTKIKGDVVTVKDSDGDKHTCDKDELKKVEPDADDKIEVGDKVTWEDTEGDDHTGKVKKIKDDDTVIVIDDEDDKRRKVDLDDLTKVEDND